MKTTPLPLPPDDTQQGSLTIQRPHPMMGRILSTQHYSSCTVLTIATTHAVSECCLSCSCPCPAPRVYPLPARMSRRLRGGLPVGGHGDVFSGGSSWTVTGPLFDLPDLLVFSCSFARPMINMHAFRRRHPTRTGLTGMLTSDQLP